MRILTFLHSFEPGGVERDALRLIAYWQANGADCPVVMGRDEGALRDEAPSLDYHVLQRGRVSTARFETAWMIARLPAEVRRCRPDVVFCAGNTYSIVAVALRAALGRECPPIVLKVSNDLARADLPAPARTAYHAWLAAQRRAFDAVVAMVPAAVPDITRHLRPRRLEVIPNASITLADIARFAAARDAAPRAAAGRHWLSVGRLVAQKNFPNLLHAFARIAGPDDRLTIIGEGYARPKLEALARTLGIAERVALPGHLNPLEAQFAGADAFVLPSDYEGLGVVLVEALAAGLPIAATASTAAIAPLVDGFGEVVPIRDPVALGNAMVRVAGRPIDRAAARARAEGFAVERVGDAWLALFATLCARPSRC